MELEGCAKVVGGGGRTELFQSMSIVSRELGNTEFVKYWCEASEDVVLYVLWKSDGSVSKLNSGFEGGARFAGG